MQQEASGTSQGSGWENRSEPRLTQHSSMAGCTPAPDTFRQHDVFKQQFSTF